MAPPLAAEIYDYLFESTIALAGGASQNVDIPLRVKTGVRRGPFVHVRSTGHTRPLVLTLSLSADDPALGNARVWFTQTVTAANVLNQLQRIPGGAWLRVTIRNGSGAAGSFPFFLILGPYLAIPQGGR